MLCRDVNNVVELVQENGVSKAQGPALTFVSKPEFQMNQLLQGCLPETTEMSFYLSQVIRKVGGKPASRRLGLDRHDHSLVARE